jgi:hypothetical protein
MPLVVYFPMILTDSNVITMKKSIITLVPGGRFLTEILMAESQVTESIHRVKMAKSLTVTRGQCYKTVFVRDLQISVLS